MSLPLAVLFTVAIAWLVRHPPITIGAHIGFRALVLFPLALLMLGGIFSFDPETHPGTKAVEWAVEGSLFAALLAQVGAIVKAKGQRLATTAIAAFGLWLSFCVAFVAGMSVTGKWL